ncbi:hypothetical protein L6452_38580 [Arctium lappa]|uniref:Uncharacterized protein n=1 Tax=Arctium lappa TaxID=4217 RepID=A0ACB8XQH5_ARCLA|nr:hypothetical protein L6452_38580 [Arctium lappa]
MTDDRSEMSEDQVLENVLENVLVFLKSRRDRNAVSLVCKLWYRAEAYTRSDVFIGNCYAVAPRRVTQRFRRVRSVTIKGKPRFADFGLLPRDWGAHFSPWLSAMAVAYRLLEKIHLKWMSVTDDDLALMAHSFPTFKELVLVCCEGFSTGGLAVVVSQCRRLRVLELIEDEVSDDEIDWISWLQAVAATCKDLREIRVFSIDATENAEGPVSDVGLLAISLGCRKLRSILYFCQQMTNAAVIAMCKNYPDLVVFQLCIFDRYRPDHVMGEPMDEGQYGKLMRTLSVAFAGDSDIGLKYVLEGCTNLQKLEIRGSPFGDPALWSGLHHFFNMRFVWMSYCRVTRQGCADVARQLPRLVVEVFRGDEVEGGERGDFVNTLYMYRSLDGPRTDVLQFVKIL